MAYREHQKGQFEFQVTCNDDHARAFAEREGWRASDGTLNTLPSKQAKQRTGETAVFRAVTDKSTEEPNSSSSLKRHNYGTPKKLKRPHSFVPIGQDPVFNHPSSSGLLHTSLVPDRFKLIVILI
ncbi:hypothetical protein I302_108605 [Kwoniella bestiolae CBS 10118]|uniref:Uncharacterized protein n=1 Tax=Kwoniella bestiolae CBS 10118 TaxID=1296100 RepID=A0A1B9FTL1_9TREE|nr:hypothetical protein I302_07743 [Kwoniella bestiolae CBS 10118]OCF22101.1 hypothetical protein I302_07743 [Kwoniella bestiolae CBS 10118]